MKSLIELTKSENTGLLELCNVTREGSVNISVSIPAGMKYLWAYGHFVPTPLTLDTIGIGFNGDVASTYQISRMRIFGSSGASISGSCVSSVGGLVVDQTSVSTPAGFGTTLELFSNITPTGQRNATVQTSFMSGTALTTDVFTFRWPDTSTEITSLDLIQKSGSTVSFSLSVIGR